MKSIIAIVVAGMLLSGELWGQVTNPYGLSEKDGLELLDLIKQHNLVRGSMGFRSAEFARMLGEANFFTERLRLPAPYPIKEADVKDFHVSPPWYSGLDRSLKNTNIPSPIDRIRAAKVTVMGNIQTANFVFAFNNGYLWNVVRLHEPAMNPSQFIKLAAKPSLINKAQAYQLATQWLTAVAVDVPALERKYKSSFYQWFIWGSPAQTNKLMLPIFDVKWGEDQMPLKDSLAAKITVLGTTKELMEMQLQDESFSHRPQMIVTNAFDLCDAPDPQAIHLNTQKTNSP